ALVGYYHSMIAARLANENRALLQPNYEYLRTTQNGEIDQRIFAMAKWTDDANVVFVFHNLWEQDVANTYYIMSPGLADKLHIDKSRSYKVVDALSGKQMGDCHSG